MPPETPSSIRAEAIAWHIRLRNDPDGDWDGFLGWLERDQRHSQVYDEVALADDGLEGPLADQLTRPEILANDNLPAPFAARGRRWAMGGLGVAAAAAAFMVFNPLPQAQPQYFEIATPPGQTRSVKLAGGGTVELNGGTRLRLERHNPRFASLTAGEAMFDIVHDPKSPFVLELDNNRLVDVGTRFNVLHTTDGHVVEVAEGSVLYNPDRERIALAAGQTLTSNKVQRRITLSRKPASEIGGWQHGRLSYRSAPLARVAGDLARNLGTQITVQPTIADRTFTGTIEIDRNETRMFARLSDLLGVAARRDKAGWTLGPQAAPAG